MTEPERWLISEGILRTIEVLRKTYDNAKWLIDATSSSRNDDDSNLSEQDQLAAELIDEAMGSSAINLARPDSSAALRLLPDASDDPDVAQHYRELTQQGLTELKHSRLVELHKTLTNVADSPDPAHHDPFDVPSANADAVLAALSDVRLVLSELLEIHDELASEELQERVLSTFFTVGGEDPDNGPPDVSPDDLVAATFVVVGYLQQSLVDGMLERFDPRGK